MNTKIQRIRTPQHISPGLTSPNSSSQSFNHFQSITQPLENSNKNSLNNSNYLQFYNNTTNKIPSQQAYLMKSSHSVNLSNQINSKTNNRISSNNKTGTNMVGNPAYINNNNQHTTQIPSNNNINRQTSNTTTSNNTNSSMNLTPFVFKPSSTKNILSDRQFGHNIINQPNYSSILSPASNHQLAQLPAFQQANISPLSSPTSAELPLPLNASLTLTPNKPNNSSNIDYFYQITNQSKGFTSNKQAILKQTNQLSKSSRSPLRLATSTSGGFSQHPLSQSFQTSSIKPPSNSPQNTSYQQQINQLSQILNRQPFVSQQQQQQQQQQYQYYPDELRYVKKTQQMIQEIGSENNDNSNANDMEKLEELDESVDQMMKELSIYQQSQKGIIPNADPTKFSLKRNNNGLVSCYAAKTHQGLVRNYNEDRVSIILNIMKPPNRQQEEDNWPKCSFFGVYDGHGGVSCADFLRDHLHQFVIRDSNFPWNPQEALKNGFELAEQYFLKQAQQQINRGDLSQVDRSGSCAVVVLIVGDTCYVANVGDSRAVISMNGGKNIQALTRDHKPMDRFENARIHQNGGRVYQTKIESISGSEREHQEEPQVMLGPYRVLPGRLSVTRTFGDIEAKFVKFGGNPHVVIAEPEIKSFKIDRKHDFIILGCDGIFDKLNSQEAGQIIWDTSLNEPLGNSIHEFCGKSIENVLKLAVSRKTQDNITAVIIGFDQFEQQLFRESDSSQNQNQLLNQLDSPNNNQSLKVPQISSPQNQLSNYNSIIKDNKISPNNQPLSPLSKSIKQNQFQQSIKQVILKQISSNGKQTPMQNTSSTPKQAQELNISSQQPSYQPSNKRALHGSLGTVINKSLSEKESGFINQKPRTCLPLGKAARNLFQTHVSTKHESLLGLKIDVKKGTSNNFYQFQKAN